VLLWTFKWPKAAPAADGPKATAGIGRSSSLSLLYVVPINQKNKGQMAR